MYEPYQNKTATGLATGCRVYQEATAPGWLVGHRPEINPLLWHLVIAVLVLLLRVLLLHASTLIVLLWIYLARPIRARSGRQSITARIVHIVAGLLIYARNAVAAVGGGVQRASTGTADAVAGVLVDLRRAAVAR